MLNLSEELKEICFHGNQSFEELYVENTLSINKSMVDGGSIIEKLPISFSPSQKYGIDYYKKFLHLGSMGKDEVGNKYDSYPCVNDPSNVTCMGSCSDRDEFIEHFKERSKTRMVCPYRISKLIWVKDIIDKYNDNDSFVKAFIKGETENGRYVETLKIWYSYRKTDFLIILFKKHNKYVFITGYPVVMKSLRTNLKKEYKESKKIRVV